MFDLQKYKEVKERELTALKAHLDKQLATLTDHLERRRISHAKTLYEDLCKQVEETDRQAIEIYERKMNKTDYPSENFKMAIQKSAKTQLEMILRGSEQTLADFRKRFIS